MARERLYEGRLLCVEQHSAAKKKAGLVCEGWLGEVEGRPRGARRGHREVTLVQPVIVAGAASKAISISEPRRHVVFCYFFITLFKNRRAKLRLRRSLARLFLNSVFFFNING